MRNELVWRAPGPAVLMSISDAQPFAVRLRPDKIYTLGRGIKCDFTLRDAMLSRDHATISLTQQGWGVQINDGARNKSVMEVDGVPIRKSAVLKDGCRISAGDDAYQFFDHLSPIFRSASIATACSALNDANLADHITLRIATETALDIDEASSVVTVTRILWEETEAEYVGFQSAHTQEISGFPPSLFDAGDPGELVANANHEVEIHGGQGVIGKLLAKGELKEIEPAFRRAKLILDKSLALNGRSEESNSPFVSKSIRSWKGESSPAIAFRRCLDKLCKVIPTRSENRIVVSGERGTGKTMLAEYIFNETSHSTKTTLWPMSVTREAVEQAFAPSEESSFIVLERLGAFDPRLVEFIVEILETQNLSGKTIVSIVDDDTEIGASVFHKLGDVLLRCPALRDRHEDISIHIDDALASCGEDLGIRRARLTSDARAILLSYEWPGNHGELLTVLRTLLLFSEEGTIAVEDIRNLGLRKDQFLGTKIMDQGRRVQLAMERTGGNKTLTASMLNISRQTLYKLLSGLGMHDSHADVQNGESDSDSHSSADSTLHT